MQFSETLLPSLCSVSKIMLSSSEYTLDNKKKYQLTPRYKELRFRILAPDDEEVFYEGFSPKPFEQITFKNPEEMTKST